jgi:hypothetical protein
VIRSALAIPRLEEIQVISEAIRESRRGWQAADEPPNDGRPYWIYLPIAQAPLPGHPLEWPRYCETLRCQNKQRKAAAFHAVINMPGEPDCAWVACADCTGLMIEGAG